MKPALPTTGARRGTDALVLQWCHGSQYPSLRGAYSQLVHVAHLTQSGCRSGLHAGAGLKAAWYGAEVFGNMISVMRGKAAQDASGGQAGTPETGTGQVNSVICTASCGELPASWSILSHHLAGQHHQHRRHVTHGICDSKPSRCLLR